VTVSYRNNRLYMEGVPLEDLAEAFGTPLYCYSATRITENFERYRKSFAEVLPKDGFTICYACKANSNQAVLRLLKNLGAGADIVSGGELARALKAGIRPSKIVYSGVGKSAEELTEALNLGLFQINVESAEELELLSRLACKTGKTARVSLRVNPNVDARTHAKITTGKKENKFGVDIGEAPAFYARARALPGIEAVGVAVHIGSQLTSLEPFARAYARLAALVRTLRRAGHDIRRVDLGGGIGITYKNETPPDLRRYAALVKKIIGPLNVHVVLEPGRSLVGDAGVLLTRVMQVKKGHGKDFLILDAAMNDLLRPSLYDAYHRVTPCRKGGKSTLYDVVGPVCETGDTFLTGERLPRMQTGDLAAIMTGGAYGAVMASTYNTRPLVAEALVKGKRFALVRARESVERLIARDKVPGWLA
jgi:diaminopimelate decarboxylase